MYCLRRTSCSAAINYLQTRSSHTRSLSISVVTSKTSEAERRARALRVLDIISSEPDRAPVRQNHRIIHHFQDCGVSRSRDRISSFLNEILREESSSSDSSCIQQDGSRFDASDLSHAVSSCGSNRDFRTGLGFHCLALKSGFISNVYVGTSLIALYGKLGELDNAYKAFDEMPEKNVVSWTAVISGFAQEWRVDICLELYSKMRNSASKANDFTFTTLLTACTGSGALGQGRSVHSQTLQLGFTSYIHISNALISMYCKCGSLEDALCIFNQMPDTDVVSWNSMIAGYAQHGLVRQAIELFEELVTENRIKPDGITYLGVLSSCRHGGLVRKGRHYFKLMFRHGLDPELDHYSCLVDLLGRFGLLQEAFHLIQSMPMNPNAVIWGSLLSSSRVHGDVWMGIRASEERLVLEPECPATHVQLANLYASVGYWKEAARVRKEMKDRGLRTNPGCSWIEINNSVFRFRAEDSSNIRVLEIVRLLHYLFDHMTCLDCSLEC
ncbi:PREDICTED: pentatricopeptide repeat-containing protein At2g37320 [Tarenaya hassleriana]|uniref:pentatricopeptide repeat-containing protein At2g37320 n=1 Tax=Tarenaya hassleriana TaxID=28532 RepID=UPI00053C3848|nr:PREDICTED: pentatricopeptide repeat-containing protein At2g37320 [Tarenaya hassleriana]